MSVEWEIKGTEYVNCNCAYGCPCQWERQKPGAGLACPGLIGVAEA